MTQYLGLPCSRLLLVRPVGSGGGDCGEKWGEMVDSGGKWGIISRG